MRRRGYPGPWARRIVSSRVPRKAGSAANRILPLYQATEPLRTNTTPREAISRPPSGRILKRGRDSGSRGRRRQRRPPGAGRSCTRLRVRTEGRRRGSRLAGSPPGPTQPRVLGAVVQELGRTNGSGHHGARRPASRTGAPQAPPRSRPRGGGRPATRRCSSGESELSLASGTGGPGRGGCGRGRLELERLPQLLLRLGRGTPALKRIRPRLA